MRTPLLIAILLSVPSLCTAQSVRITGTYTDLDGDQLPLISAQNLTVTVFDDNGDSITSNLVPNVQPRQVAAGQQLQPDRYTLTFNAPVIPNRTVSILFDAPGRDPVTIPRILAQGNQVLNVVLPKPTKKRCCCGTKRHRRFFRRRRCR